MTAVVQWASRWWIFVVVDFGVGEFWGWGFCVGGVRGGGVHDGGVRDGRVRDGRVRDGRVRDGRVRDGRVRGEKRQGRPCLYVLDVDFFERLFEVGNQIFCVFDANAQPDQ